MDRKKTFSFKLKCKSKHFIWGKVVELAGPAPYYVSGIYGSPRRDMRIAFVNKLSSLIPPATPWIALGDLNTILDESEKAGGR